MRWRRRACTRRRRWRHKLRDAACAAAAPIIRSGIWGCQLRRRRCRAEVGRGALRALLYGRRAIQFARRSCATRRCRGAPLAMLVAPVQLFCFIAMCVILPRRRARPSPPSSAADGPRPAVPVLEVVDASCEVERTRETAKRIASNRRLLASTSRNEAKTIVDMALKERSQDPRKSSRLAARSTRAPLRPGDEGADAPALRLAGSGASPAAAASSSATAAHVHMPVQQAFVSSI